MAASGFTPIQLYRTTTAAAAPVSGNLVAGEIAININDADMAIYAKNNTGNVKRLINNPVGLKYPTTDGTANQAVVTDGSGNLSFNTFGYINIPQNSQSAAYTLVLADAGKHIFHPSSDANARTFTIPSNASVAYIIGTAITFVNMTTQVVSIAIDTDTLYLSSSGATGTRSLNQYGSATALKITSTTWLISGSGLT